MGGGAGESLILEMAQEENYFKKYVELDIKLFLKCIQKRATNTDDTENQYLFRDEFGEDEDGNWYHKFSIYRSLSFPILFQSKQIINHRNDADREL